MSSEVGHYHVMLEMLTYVRRCTRMYVENPLVATRSYGTAHGKRTKRYDDLYNGGELGPTRSAAAAMSSMDT
jgi:hypothetical protein